MARKRHKLTYQFLRGRSRAVCSCGVASRWFSFPQDKGRMMVSVRKAHPQVAGKP